MKPKYLAEVLLASIIAIPMAMAAHGGNYNNDGEDSSLKPVVAYVLAEYRLDNPLYSVEYIGLNETSDLLSVVIHLPNKAKYYSNDTIAGLVKTFDKPLIDAKKTFPNVQKTFLSVECRTWNTTTEEHDWEPVYSTPSNMSETYEA